MNIPKRIDRTILRASVAKCDQITAELREYEATQDRAANDSQNINDRLDKLRASWLKRFHGDELAVRKSEFEIAIDDSDDPETLSTILYELLLAGHDLNDSQTYRDLLAEGVRGC